MGRGRGKWFLCCVIFEFGTVRDMGGVILMVIVRVNATIEVTKHGSSLVVSELGEEGRSVCLTVHPLLLFKECFRNQLVKHLVPLHSRHQLERKAFLGCVILV